MTLCFFIAYLSFGYSINACFSSLVGDTSGTINLLTRLILLFAGFGLLFYSLFLKKHSIPIYSIPIIFFLLVYSMRLLYDVEVLNMYIGSLGIFKFYTIYYGNIIVPIFCIILLYKFINSHTLNIYTYWIIVLSNVFIFIYLISKFGLSKDLFLTRFSLVAESSTGENVHVINPITLAYYGEILFLLSIIRLAFRQGHKVINFSFLTLGLINLMLGASRGPFLSTFLLLLVIFLFIFKVKRKTPIFLFKQILLLVTVTIVFIFTILYAIENKISAVIRILETADKISEGKKDERQLLWEDAWNSFLDSPIYGEKYLAFSSFYPHNIYLEVLMATGLIGGLLFFSAILGSFWKFWKFSKQEKIRYFSFFILLLSLFLSNFTSGCLFLSVPFWVMWISFLVFPHKERYQGDLSIQNKEKQFQIT